MIVLGFDPGFAQLGAGVLELHRSSTRVLHHETFLTAPDDGDDCSRLDLLANHALDLIEQYDPEAIGYEDQAGVMVALAKSGAAGMNADARRLLEVCGIIRCAARCYNLPCYAVTPRSAKVAVLGKGKSTATKDTVKERVRQIFHVARISEHAADAIAIGVATGVRHGRAKLELAEHAALLH